MKPTLGLTNKLFVPSEPKQANKQIKLAEQTNQWPRSGYVSPNLKSGISSNLGMIKELQVSGSEANMFLQKAKQAKTHSISVLNPPRAQSAKRHYFIKTKVDSIFQTAPSGVRFSLKLDQLSRRPTSDQLSLESTPNLQPRVVKIQSKTQLSGKTNSRTVINIRSLFDQVVRKDDNLLNENSRCDGTSNQDLFKIIH